MTYEREGKDAARIAALARISEILDRTAEAEGISPQALRQAIGEAIPHTSGSDAPVPEEAVLSLLLELF
ncbi:MAG: hypothetical protein J6S76_04260 [Clostridia bacterium]|nr:hypothetical protein [Clostridia bacterium]